MKKDLSSFRDPSGFVIEYQDEIYRHIDSGYAEHFELLEVSGLLEKLWTDELLVTHQPASTDLATSENSYRTIKAEKIPVISYPYEWGFSQLKEAALLTLKILQVSLDHGMILKDASAFNVQFKGCKPVFIDTLSFVKYEDSQPWMGYRQFCEHFLAPLCMASYRGAAFQSLGRSGVDGIPLKMASMLLPAHTWFRITPLLHIHLHAKAQAHYSVKRQSFSTGSRKIPKRNLVALIDHLTGFISGMQLRKSDKTQWQHYGKETHYSGTSLQHKASIIKEFVKEANPSVVWDVGANDGYFSRVIAAENRLVLSLDSDPLAIEKNFLHARREPSAHVLPLLFDIVNPSPAIGWANQERAQLFQRSKPALIMALAVIHHIVIVHNIPFYKIAEYFAAISPWLIIEFIPKEDEKIKTLPETAGKSLYSRENFELGFFPIYKLIKEYPIKDSERSILLLKRI